MYQELKIVADPGRARRRYAKSRAFTGYLLGMVEADGLWEKGAAGKGRRPVFIAYATTRGAARPFTACLRGGHRVEWGYGSSADSCIEVPKSSPHRWSARDAAGDAVITTGFVPDLFQIEPVVPPERVTFISMPPRWWVDREAARLEGAFGADARDVVKAGLVAAHLDRRIALPILSDLRFQRRFHQALLASPLVLKKSESAWSHDGIRFQGMEECGLEEPVAVDASHEDVAALLRSEVKKFFEEVLTRDGEDRERQGGRVLPGARKAPVQLCFDFEVENVA